MAYQQVGRNESCPCGSGLKYKRCCLEKDAAVRVDRKGQVQQPRGDRGILWGIAGAIVVAGVVLTAIGHFDWGIGVGVGGLLILGAYIIIRDPPPPRSDTGDPSGINFGG